jgi:hypothetical protein
MPEKYEKCVIWSDGQFASAYISEDLTIAMFTMTSDAGIRVESGEESDTMGNTS